MQFPASNLVPGVIVIPSICVKERILALEMYGIGVNSMFVADCILKQKRKRKSQATKPR
jgi:hypothetical protein